MGPEAGPEVGSEKVAVVGPEVMPWVVGPEVKGPEGAGVSPAVFGPEVGTIDPMVGPAREGDPEDPEGARMGDLEGEGEGCPDNTGVGDPEVVGPEGDPEGKDPEGDAEGATGPPKPGDADGNIAEGSEGKEIGRAHV